MISANVVDPQSGKKSNPFHRTTVDQSKIGTYLSCIVPLFVRVRAFTPLQKLMNATKILTSKAKTIADRSTATLHATLSDDVILTGAITIADVMISAFTNASAPFDSMTSASADATPATQIPLNWGPQLQCPS